MSTPRPIDKTRADPVHHRERSATPRANKTHLQPDGTTDQNNLRPDSSSRRQEIVLSIPQQQKDEDENSEVISNATSLVNLDSVAKTTENATINQEESQCTNEQHIIVESKTLGGTETNTTDMDGPLNGTAANLQDTEHGNCNVDTAEHLEFKPDARVTKQVYADGVRTNAVDGKDMDDENHTVNLDTCEHPIKPEPTGPTDPTASALVPEEEDFDEVKTVPDVDSEVQAVLARNTRQRACEEREIVDLVMAERNAQAMVAALHELNNQDGPLEGPHTVSRTEFPGEALRGKTCTPTSYYTDASEMKHLLDDKMSQGAEVQEAMFRQALSLLDERCISRDSTRGRQIMAQLTQAYPSTPIQHSRSHTRSVVTLTEPSVIALRDDMETPLVSLKQHTYGQHRPEYFYVHQRKPTPMPPLQAWKGYYGNVYFAPISVQPARPVPPPRPPQQHLASCSDKLQAILLKQRRLSTSPQHSRSRSVTSRHTTGSAGTKGATESNPRHPSASSTHSRRQSQPVQSRASMRSWFSGAKSSAANSTVSRQMSRLYKSVVLNDFNENISEDVTWINGLESTGTLLFDPGVQPEKRQPRSPQPPREKLRRGSTTLARSQSTKIYKHEYPELDVKGGRCSEPKPNSLALLRSRTELPFSKYNRLPFKSTTSDYGQISPMAALSGIRSNEVPSMDQLRASLRQMENVATKDELIRMVPTSQRRAHSLSDMKRVPYVKFSPEYRVPHPPTNHSICV